jgi:exodeoxyribonuclease-3
MKLMTYNVLDGGAAGLDLVVDVIKQESPDYLTVNEANTFANNDYAILKEVAEKTGFPHYELALSGEYDYHVAVLSKYPFKKVHKLTPLMRACIVAVIETELGEISVASLHLTPYSEDLRHPEIDLITNFQKQHEKRIFMGDMNSLSRYDGYNEGMIKNFNDIQIKKFTTNGKLRFDAIDKILSVGYFDAAYEVGKNNEHTVPTPANKDNAHSDMRLDYIFISGSLLPRLIDYEVVKNGITDKASDHYPVIAILR